MEVYPGDPFDIADVETWVGELIGAGLVVEYESQSQSYWQVTGWDRHQKIDKPTIKYPGPFDEGSTIIRRGVGEASRRSLMETNGDKESKGVESKGDEGVAAAPHVVGGDEETALSELVERWNAIDGVRPCKVENTKRRAAYNARRKESGWLDRVDEALSRVAQSSFCRGGGVKGWVADLDWFLRPGTLSGLLEGKYDDRPTDSMTELERRNAMSARNWLERTGTDDTF
jgi:hypothetical protein